jgi:Protein of unknown function (DUF3124).
MRLALFSVVIFFAVFSCNSEKLKETNRHSDFHAVTIDPSILAQQKKVYVPIYSDIYYMDAHHTFSLTATLSIRNVSLNDSIYIFSVDYYNSGGKKLRTYTESTLLVKPMESIEFVVENRDDTGGVGANFVVGWGAKPASHPPYIQGIMIGTSGQQGISFTTEGIDIQ